MDFSRVVMLPLFSPFLGCLVDKGRRVGCVAFASLIECVLNRARLVSREAVQTAIPIFEALVDV